MGFTPFPSVGTRIGIEGGALRSGDVLLRSGVGLSLSEPSPGIIQADGVAPSPRLHGHLFHAGPLTAELIGTLLNPEPEPVAALTFLEANLGEAVAGADASNHYALRVSAAGGQVDLPLINSRYFNFDNISNVPHTGADPDNRAGTSGTRGQAHLIEPTADRIATGVRWSTTMNSFETRAIGLRSVCYNADRTVLLAASARADVNFPGAGSSVILDYGRAFLSAIELKQGERYWIGWEADQIIRVDTSANWNHNNHGTGRPLLGTADTDTEGFPDLQLRAIQAGDPIGTTFHADDPTDTSFTTSLRAWDITAFGGPSGVILTGGEISVELVAVGTPPASGADLNIAMTWGTS